MFVVLETLEKITFQQLQELFENVSFSLPITDTQLEDKLPRCVVLEYDPAPTLGYLEKYVDGPLRQEGMQVFQTWIVVPPTTDDWLADSTRLLNAKSRQAGAQISALNTRISAWNWAIYEQDPEDPDYEPATPEEIAELPVRTAQLTKWNSYNRKLGQLKTSATWPVNPTWPVMPEPYTNETSKSANPV